MGLTQHIVVGVVGRSHLQATRTEFDIHVAVLDDGNHTAHQRHDHLAALQPLVLRVLGVDTHGGITHDGLRTGGSHHSVVALLILMDDVAISLECLLVVESLQTVNIIFQMEQVTLLLAIDHFLGREGGECLRIPVHHAESAIDESLVIEVNEYLDDTLRTLLVHREGGAVPVAAGTQAAQLLQDDATVLISPVPGVLQELLTGEIALLDAFGGEFLHHLGFCSDRGMVSTRYPAGILTFHTGTAHQDILNRIVQHVPHVEHTSHVGRWNDDGVGLTTVWFARKELMLCPVLVPFSLDFCGAVFCC